MADKNGIVTGLQMKPELKSGIIDQCIWGSVGDTVEDYMKYKAGILFIQESDVKSLYEKVQRFHELAVVQVQ